LPEGRQQIDVIDLKLSELALEPFIGFFEIVGVSVSGRYFDDLSLQYRLDPHFIRDQRYDKPHPVQITNSFDVGQVSHRIRKESFEIFIPLQEDSADHSFELDIGSAGKEASVVVVNSKFPILVLTSYRYLVKLAK
jgi:hypothetical protein